MPNNTNDIELRTEEVRDILTAVPHWMIRYGNVLFLALIVLLLFFTWLIKYPDVVVSEAVVTTRIPPQKEYAKSTGRISRLLVANNQIVHSGQVLAVMENPARHEDIFLLKSTMDTVPVHSDAFSFSIDSLPVLLLGDLEADFAVFQNNYIQYRLNRELQPYLNEDLANRASEAELRNRLLLLENQMETNRRELAYKEKELQRHRELFTKGVIAAQDLEAKEMEYLQANRNYKNLEVSVSQLQENRASARRNTRGNRIAQSSEELKLLKQTLQSFSQLKKAIRDWELRYAFVSNIDGQVSFINIWNENQVVNTGDLAFSIVPIENTGFIARLRTPAQNSGKVNVGQRVNIRLENFPDEEFGILTGKVNNVSLLPDSEGLYAVEVSFPEAAVAQGTLTTSYGKEIAFTQEMRGVAEIVTEDLRLIERFFYQLRAIFNRG